MARIRIRTAAGTEHEFPILSLSLKGLSFRVDGRAWSFHAEQMLGRTKLRVGGYRIRGTAIVSHLRPVLAGETTCGVHFDPESDEDRTALIAAVEYLAERQ